MNNIKNITLAFAGTVVRVALIIIAIVCISNYAKKAYDFGYRVFAEEPMSAPPGRDISFVVGNDDAQSDIYQMLEDKGIIRDHMLFSIQKKISVYKDDIKPGSYTLNTSMNSDEILEVLVGKENPDDEAEGEEDYSEEVNPLSDDVTGIDSAGVLGEEGQYDEAAAFEDTEETQDESAGNEFEGEGDEESAIEEQ